MKFQKSDVVVPRPEFKKYEVILTVENALDEEVLANIYEHRAILANSLASSVSKNYPEVRTAKVASLVEILDAVGQISYNKIWGIIKTGL